MSKSMEADLSLNELKENKIDTGNLFMNNFQYQLIVLTGMQKLVSLMILV